MDILIAIADQTNAYEIAEEMTQVGGRQLGPVLLAAGGVLCAVPAVQGHSQLGAATSMWTGNPRMLPSCSVLQYVKDVDEDLARAAIRAVGQIALKASCGHPPHSKGRPTHV